MVICNGGLVVGCVCWCYGCVWFLGFVCVVGLV